MKILMFVSEGKKFRFGLAVEDFILVQCVGDVIKEIILFGDGCEDQETIADATGE